MPENTYYNSALPFIVFTDLDGTLLDHNNYTWEDAAPALEKLNKLNIPVIFNTSKSVKEALSLQKKMTISAPFIVENGSALYVPSNIPKSIFTKDGQVQEIFNSSLTDDYYYILFGEHRKKLLGIAHQARLQNQWSFEGFADWTTDKVMELTRLDEETAKQAMDRQYSEPFLWQDNDSAFKNFTSFLQTKQLQILKGGRFYHIIGQTNKAKPILYLKQTLYKQAKTKVICLGDSANDIDMLDVADFPVCIRSPVNEYFLPKKKGVYFTNNFGPNGWNEAIEKLLKENLISNTKTNTMATAKTGK